MMQRYKSARDQRKVRMRRRLKARTGRMRLSVFRSGKFVSAQVVDDGAGRTVAAAREIELAPAKKKGTKMARAAAVGALLAKKALGAGVKSVVFDRGGYGYHGRVKALAEAARKGGLKF